MIKIFLTISLVLALAAVGTAAPSTPGVEMTQSEVVAEQMYEHGVGAPWVGGNPPKYEQAPTLVLPIKKEIARQLYYKTIGSTYAYGYLIIGEGTNRLAIPCPSGTYTVLGCYDSRDNLAGVYVDLGKYYS
jgi:hypothetical protein